MADTTASVPVVRVAFPGALRQKVGNKAIVMAVGHTVREVIDDLEQAYPGMRFHLCFETGELRTFVNIFLNAENIRYLQGLDTPLVHGATLHIFPSVAGGSL
ncbi:MAG TPA: ubiquitin-like small modifier protein 1 [Ktedonobacteraceae bacterium]|nr:ubiquitin-like small modifier protein 1 [Ktedonobacteraceae bacterium]